jgi:hypothetical protein
MKFGSSSTFIPVFLLVTGLAGIYNGVRQTNVNYNWYRRNEDTTTATKKHPPPKIFMTNYGWNHFNQSHALNFVRSQRQRDLVQAVQNHPWFHPTGWQDSFHANNSYYQDNNDNNTNNPQHVYVFLDLETCFESNWPTMATA